MVSWKNNTNNQLAFLNKIIDPKLKNTEYGEKKQTSEKKAPITKKQSKADQTFQSLHEPITIEEDELKSNYYSEILGNPS